MVNSLWNPAAVCPIAESSVRWCFFCMHIDDGFVRSVHGALDTHSVSVVFHFIHYTPNAVSGSARHTNIAHNVCCGCSVPCCILALGRLKSRTNLPNYFFSWILGSSLHGNSFLYDFAGICFIFPMRNFTRIDIKLLLNPWHVAKMII